MSLIHNHPEKTSLKSINDDKKIDTFDIDALLDESCEINDMLTIINNDIIEISHDKSRIGFCDKIKNYTKAPAILLTNEFVSDEYKSKIKKYF